MLSKDQAIQTVSTFVLLHTAAFLLEYLYQTYCFRLSTVGYLTSLFTHSSTVCTQLRATTTVLHDAVVAGVLSVVLSVSKK